MTSQQEVTSTTLTTSYTVVIINQNASDCEVDVAEQYPQPTVPETKESSTSPKGKTRLLRFIVVVAILVEVCFATRGSLLVARYATPGESCSNHSNAPEHHQIFTALMYGICSILRCIEYLLLAHGFYNFVSTVDSSLYRKERRRIVTHIVKKLIMSFWGFVLIVLIPTLLLLSVAIPILGIAIELRYTQTTHCKEHNSGIFIAYCAFNIVRYLFASCARLLMAVAAIEVGRIWSVDELDDCPANTANAEHQSQTELFLTDWTDSTDKHDQLSQQYKECGEKSKQIGEIFKTWFLVPWITFFIATSIKTTNVLSPWLQGEEVDKEVLPAVYYMMYNIFQVISLLVTYLSGLKMNTHHHVYYTSLRKAQLNAYNCSSRQALARILHIEKKEQYDFIPHVAFTHIKVRMDNPMYVILLLLGTFLAVCGGLF